MSGPFFEKTAALGIDRLNAIGGSTTVQQAALAVPLLRASLQRAYAAAQRGQTKLASRTDALPDVTQLSPYGDGYRLLLADRMPDGGATVTEHYLSYKEAAAVFPQEMIDTADAQGAATLSGVEATPDILEEQQEQITRYGVYRVTEEATGHQLLGYVFPSMFDYQTQQFVPQALFSNGSAYAVQPEVFGTLVSVSTSLPIGGQPRGLGAFCRATSSAAIVTTPVVIETTARVDGVIYLIGRDPVSGAQLKFRPGDETMRVPVPVGDGVIMLPPTYEWLPLEHEVGLMGAGNALQQKLAASIDRNETVSISAGLGSVELHGAGLHVKGASYRDAVLQLALLGVPQNLSGACIQKSAAARGTPVLVSGVAPLPHATAVGNSDGAAKAAAAAAACPAAVDLLPDLVEILASQTHAALGVKTAEASLDADSVDSILGLNFLTPDNVQEFVDHLPALEEAVSKLASLVLACQLGLQTVPYDAVVRAMDGTEKTVRGLRALKSFQS